MTDEIKLNRDITRQSQAEALLRNELLVEAWDTIERDLIKGLIETRPDAAEHREKIYQAIHINRKHRDFLVKAIANGRLAQKELDDITGKRRILGIAV